MPTHTKGPAAQGGRGRAKVTPDRNQAAGGARETPLEDVRALVAAAVVALAIGHVARGAAELRLGLVGLAVEHDLVVLDSLQHRAPDGVMMLVGAVRFGQHDLVAAHLVDGANMGVVGADHVHMLLHLAEHLTLGHALPAPAREIILEARLILAAIIVIIAVERFQMATAPLAVVRVVLARARLALRILAPGAAIVARHRPILVALLGARFVAVAAEAVEAGAAHEAAGVGAAIAFVAIARVAGRIVTLVRGAAARHRVVAAIAVAVIVAEPAGDLVAGAFEPAAAGTVVVAVAAAPVGAILPTIVKARTRLAPTATG